MTRLQELKGLSEYVSKLIAEDPEEWKKFLVNASRFTWYPFEDQILIYAQRPDATACASMELWNNRMNCWVNRGAKGIALIDDDGVPKPRLKYVFDVKDVHEARFIGHKPIPWQMKPEYHQAVIDALKDKYGPRVIEGGSFRQTIRELCELIAAETIEEYVDGELKHYVDGSKFEGLETYEMEDPFARTVADSLCYMVLSRCGEEYVPSSWYESFIYLNKFNSVDTLNVLGNAIRDQADPLLNEIGRTVRECDRNIQLQNTIRKNEKILENGYEKVYNADGNILTDGINYTEDIQKDSENTNTVNVNGERSTYGTELNGADGSTVHTGRGLSDTEPKIERGTGGAAHEVRNEEETIPEGQQTGNIRSDAPQRNLDGTLPDNPKAGRGKNGPADRADGESRGSEREPQSNRTDEVGKDDEQHQGIGRGDGTEGTGIRIKDDNLPDEQEQQENTVRSVSQNGLLRFEDTEHTDSPEPRQLNLFDLFPSMEEQMGTITAAEASVKHTKPAAFSLSADQIDEVLRSGGGQRESRKRIYAKYQEGKTPAEMVEFLKDEYKIVAKGYTFDKHPVAFWFNGNGVEAGYGTSAFENNLLVMDWDEIEANIRRQVENGSYMGRSEAFLVMPYERKRLSEAITYFFVDGIENIPESVFGTDKGYPSRMETVADRIATHEGRQTVISELQKAQTDIEDGRKGLRWRYVKRPEYLINELIDLDKEMITYPLKDEVTVNQGDFVTQDEIEELIRGGSGFQERNFRIYEYFNEHHETKDNVAFLKKEYGIGGRSDALIGTEYSWADHDGKGLRLRKGNLMAPYADILLNWNQVEKIIRKMVNENIYLRPEAKEEYEQRKLKNAQEQLKEEQEELQQTLTADDVEDEHFPKRLEGRFQDAFLQKDNDIQSEIQETENNERLTGTEETEIVERISEQEKLELEQQKKVREEMAAKAQNFHITNENLGAGTPKEKFRNNIEAIKTLQLIESEQRVATLNEQEVLSKYVGWGGLSDAFDESKTNWRSEYNELKNLLSPEEYASARSSTLNAHYTSPTVIGSIYEALDHMGFRRGNILEPAMGIGNFFGMLPENMSDSRLYGVELDSVSGRIAKLLYPKANIQVKGYEKTDFPNDFFDVAIGNVPFGDYKIPDRQYDKNNFLIHDYFFAKSLDKVRPGGVVAFVTSKGTMDKQNPSVRRYLAQRAELIGAIRLPNTAFKENAGTEVTSDILFFKKRDRLVDLEPDWVHLGMDENGVAMNSYFIDHPEMIMGKMEMVTGPFGMESTCQPDITRPLSEQLLGAMSHITGTYDIPELSPGLGENGLDSIDSSLTENSNLKSDIIPADPTVKNFSYCLVDDKVYYRENSIMHPAGMSENMEARIKGMIGIRDCTQQLINMQMDDYSDEAISIKQKELNALYDDFSKTYGLISSQTNKRAFNQDSSYCLLCSLEKLDDEGKFQGKADMFTKRTIKKAEPVTSVDTASEALAVSLSEKAGIDLEYMSKLTGKSENELTEELKGIIFKNPLTVKWETADEYLSGNVRHKLQVARRYADNNDISKGITDNIINPLDSDKTGEKADTYDYSINVFALERVQPKDLDASEIEVRIGATWIEPRFIVDFMRDTFHTPDYLIDRGTVSVNYSDITGQWNVSGKNADYGNALVHSTYGTGRANAYKILEDSLNLKDTRIFDIEMEDGKEKRILNKKETMLASQKQEAIREAFKDWVFRDQERRMELVGKYNELFNSTRPREYDGSHLTFPGMTPDIELRPHQKNAVAHILYGNNTLLAHVVGAGKTWSMAAAAMESKRLGLCQKSLFVVPNHLTEQWASDFLRLYPGANILAATKKDFEPANRKKFCSRIATGDYDAVIIGHSQFERIPLSTERQIAIIEKQIDEIEMAIQQTKADHGERYTIKQMEKSRKNLVAKLDKLNDQTRKDNVITFEQLGVDRLFVDESHGYKNLFLYTKMRNVAGIAQTEAQKSQDMFNKCQYLDELTGGKGITFASGTPVSNSMCELYTVMRYLQNSTLQQMGLGQFDSWAATFGETQTAIELAPEGTGYRAKTRFSKFFNLPELISLFKESADIETSDMLNLPVPEAEYENVVLKPSEAQKEMVKSLADRAELVRNRAVDPSEDNMLKITNDGRKLALDQRLISDMLPDDENSKTNACIDRAYKIWQDTAEKKSTQLIFCDLSTPKGDGTFNVYDDIREKLVAKGVPREQIAFIHEANTELRKTELFAKVRSGQVRFLIGSTAKMGAGTNVQDKLIALHHLDVPWRPSDIEQQEGRILRQGNTNPKVSIFRYVTEGTFDAYSWQLIENKQKFIGQIMTSKSPVRSCEDIDDAALSYAEVKALATGNPYIREKMDLDIQVSKLKLLKANHTSQKYRLEDQIAVHYPKLIETLKERIEGFKADISLYDANKPEKSQQTTVVSPDKAYILTKTDNPKKAEGKEQSENFRMTVAGKTYEERKDAGSALISICREMKAFRDPTEIGEYLGFKMSAKFEPFTSKFNLILKGKISHEIEIGADASGNITRINNLLEGMEKQLEEVELKLKNAEQQLEIAKAEVTKPFEKEQELNDKLMRLSELNALLNMDEKGDNALDIDEEAGGDNNLAIASEKKAAYIASEPEVAYTPIPQGKQALRIETNDIKDGKGNKSSGPFHQKLQDKMRQIQESKSCKAVPIKTCDILKKNTEKGAI